jgi:hypothetical protein
MLWQDDQQFAVEGCRNGGTNRQQNGGTRWKLPVSRAESERLELIPHYRLTVERGIVPDLDELVHRPAPVVCFTDGAGYYVAEGVFRYRAYIAVGERNILCDVRPGGFLDALRFAASNRLSLVMADLMKAVALLEGYQATRRWNDERAGKCLKAQPQAISAIRSMMRVWNKRHTASQSKQSWEK